MSTTKFCYYHKWSISLSEVKYNATSNLITMKMSIIAYNIIYFMCVWECVCMHVYEPI